MTKKEIEKVEKYLENRRLTSPTAERLLELINGKPDHVKDGYFKKHIQPVILQRVIYGGLL